MMAWIVLLYLQGDFQTIKWINPYMTAYLIYITMVGQGFSLKI